MVAAGAVLSMDAAAAGLPVNHLVLFEPPFVVDDDCGFVASCRGVGV